MNPKPSKQKPQLTLGLKYSEIKIFRFLIYRARRVSHILDQLTYWRSPILWFLIFLNGVLVYFLYPLVLSLELPPEIPIFNYALTAETILLPSSSLLLLLGVFLAVQLVSVFIASRTFYRSKQLALFILLASVMTTVLFGITMYKSISLTLPIS